MSQWLGTHYYTSEWPFGWCGSLFVAEKERPFNPGKKAPQTNSEGRLISVSWKMPDLLGHKQSTSWIDLKNCWRPIMKSFKSWDVARGKTKNSVNGHNWFTTRPCEWRPLSLRTWKYLLVFTTMLTFPTAPNYVLIYFCNRIIIVFFFV